MIFYFSWTLNNIRDIKAMKDRLTTGSDIV